MRISQRMPDVPRQTARPVSSLPPLTTPPPTPVETVKTPSRLYRLPAPDTPPTLRPRVVNGNGRQIGKLFQSFD